MIAMIEDKINAYIDSILQKDVIDHTEYQVLANEVMRLRLVREKEKTNKQCQESAERMQKIAEMLAAGGPFVPV